MARLTGPQTRELRKALQQAFSLSRFDLMLREQLDVERENIALGDDATIIVSNVIQSFNRDHTVEKLLVGALAAKPDHPLLVGVAAELGLIGRGAPSAGDLETILDPDNPFLDVALFRGQLARLEPKLCRVEIDGDAAGTGFLVGPDLVMTNYHVVMGVIQGKEQAGDVICRFDYKKLIDGPEANAGREVALADGDAWLVDHSPYSQVDLKPDPKPGLPSPDELDYALLRLAEAVGDEAIGNPDATVDEGRGWIDLSESRDAELGKPLFILTHPDGAPLKLAWNTPGARAYNDNRTRLFHTVNTEPGSSGSPCFDHRFRPVALHHSGDPGFATPSNEAIPFKAIVAKAEAHLDGG